MEVLPILVWKIKSDVILYELLQHPISVHILREKNKIIFLEWKSTFIEQVI